MSKLPRFRWLAGLIPAYSAQEHQVEYAFSVNQLISPEISVLDIAIFTCALVGCDSVVIIAEMEQIPYLKLRYGDAFFDAVDVKLEGNKIHPQSARPMGIYYISASRKYSCQKLDTYCFNLHHAANLFSQAYDESFELMIPSHFFICQPWHIISPIQLVKYRNAIRRAIGDAKLLRMLFEFRAKKDDKLISIGDRSHICISGKQMLEPWKFFQDNFMKLAYSSDQTGIRKKIQNSTFAEHHPEHDSFHAFFFEENEVFNLLHWKENVRLLQHMISMDDETRKFYDLSELLVSTNIKFLPNLQNLEKKNPFNDLQLASLRNTKKKNFKEVARWKRNKKKTPTRAW